MSVALSKGERFGILRPPVDAHSLGVSIIIELLRGCGIRAVVAEGEVRESLARLDDPAAARVLAEWARGERLSALGFSWRLDPEEGLRHFAGLVEVLRAAALIGGDSAPLRALYFAGLPAACDLVQARFPFVAGVFRGDETAAESLQILGLGGIRLPSSMAADLGYDEDRMAFGRELVAKGEWKAVRPVDRSGYPRFGRRGDGLVARIAHGRRRNLPPLMRAHAGPWLPDRREAVALFEEWTSRLAKSGFLDILSIGTSQLSQSAFGENWEGRPDGGGVPLDSPEAFGRIWELARPMLVRSYSGTNDVAGMAKMLEERIDIAWHALSFWWFSRLDGRGPHGVLNNLERHFEAIDFIAASGKPFEPNVPHHFAFRGADDTSYVVSGWLAACAAKERGVRDLVLQVMLNTPKYTWGVNDLAKARALLQLVRELEDGNFSVHLQPRGGLDYFSGDESTAKAQLAAVTALMDDIEPWDAHSPEIIHVVSWSEGMRLADPDVIDDSIRITRQALSEWRRLRAEGLVDDMSRSGTVLRRTSELLAEARSVIAAICATVPDPFSPAGMYRILASGFLPIPWLAELREEFPEAARWKTGMVDGAVKVVDGEGMVIPAERRIPIVIDRLKRGPSPASGPGPR